MDEELGILADKKAVSEIAKELSAKWSFKDNPPQDPIVLMISGFQGSGKTTVLSLLQKDLDLIVISPDEIRHKLIEREWKVSEQFVHTVNATRNNLLKNALTFGHHIAIDQLTNPVRINLAQSIINDSTNKYKLLKIYLKASEDTSIKRLQLRQQLKGIYKGTVGELKNSIIEHGEPDLSLYYLVLDSEKLTPLEIAEKLQGLVDI